MVQGAWKTSEDPKAQGAAPSKSTSQVECHLLAEKKGSYHACLQHPSLKMENEGGSPKFFMALPVTMTASSILPPPSSKRRESLLSQHCLRLLVLFHELGLLPAPSQPEGSHFSSMVFLDDGRAQQNLVGFADSSSFCGFDYDAHLSFWLFCFLILSLSSPSLPSCAFSFSLSPSREKLLPQRPPSLRSPPNLANPLPRDARYQRDALPGPLSPGQKPRAKRPRPSP